VQLVTVRELAAFLRLSTMTVYRAVENGELPGAKRIGRSIRIPVTSVPEYVKSIGIPPSLRSISALAGPGSGQPGPHPEEEQQ
jgi:excisionase family DNA binding protein